MYTWPPTLDYQKSARIGSFKRMTEKPQSMCFETEQDAINNQVYCSELKKFHFHCKFISEVQIYHLISTICIDEVKNVTISTILYQ